jgi:hypothetical protein
MLDVVAGGPGFVAVGWVSFGLDRAAAVWTSPDGIAWARVPHDEEVLGPSDWDWMNSVTAGGPGLVAVGGTSFEEKDAAVWTSVDGVTWSPVERDDAVFGGDGAQEMMSVTAGGPGLVAVGREVDPVEFELDAAVWTSPDGLTWTRIENDGEVFGGEDTQEMWDVTAGGPGLVAVGVDWEVELPPDAAAWTSDDGVSWSRVGDESVFGGQSTQQIWSVTEGGPGLIAVGVSIVDDVFAHEAAVWTSADGVNWARTAHDDDVFGGEDDQDMLGVTTDGEIIVIVGSGGPAGDSHAAAWVGS